MVKHRILPLTLAVVALLCRGGDDAQQRIVGRAFGDTPLLRDVSELCDRVGGRPTGSPARERAIEWGAAKLKAAGADSVVTGTFSVPRSLAESPGRLTREEVRKQVADTKLDVQMKAFAQWEDFQAGKRGMK